MFLTIMLLEIKVIPGLLLGTKLIQKTHFIERDILEIALKPTLDPTRISHAEGFNLQGTE